VNEVRAKVKKAGRKVTIVIPDESDESSSSESEKDES
jgi:hypothetical protein